MRFWYWIWDDWFFVAVGWLLPAVALGILAGGLVANLRFDQHCRRAEAELTGDQRHQ